jgi:hypothetical protein
VRVREYRVPHNGSVNCSIAPGDDIVIAHLEAPLTGVTRLDLLEMDAAGRKLSRMEDIPFSAAAGGVAFAPRVDLLRTLPTSTTRLRLLAVETGGERVIGEYTFHHSPYGT